VTARLHGKDAGQLSFWDALRGAGEALAAAIAPAPVEPSPYGPPRVAPGAAPLADVREHALEDEDDAGIEVDADDVDDADDGDADEGDDIVAGPSAGPAAWSRKERLVRTAAFMARLRGLGLTARVHSLVLTRNRTVMVSVARGVLRVHEGFVDADDATLAAIVTFVQARDSAARRRAQQVITTHPITVKPPRRTAVQHPADAPLAARLTALHAELNARHFGGALQPLEVRVSRRLARRLGHYTLRSAMGGRQGQIVLGTRHIRRDGWPEATHTLLHEMVHQWQDETGRPVDHGPEFRRKCREVGITPAATRRL
jgi:hypothetical protein